MVHVQRANTTFLPQEFVDPTIFYTTLAEHLKST